MNWLSHILLSKKDVEFQLGNLLADPLKGRVWEDASRSVENGMMMHKSIDKFTDAHPIVAKSKKRLDKKGYLKGVVIDLLYDHYLALNWDEYTNIPYDEFLELFYSGAQKVSSNYPKKAKILISNLVNSNSLGKHDEFSGFVESLERIDNRLSPRARSKDSAISYLPLVEAEYENLKADFEDFFPELIKLFKEHELGSKSDNFLIKL